MRLVRGRAGDGSCGGGSGVVERDGEQEGLGGEDHIRRHGSGHTEAIVTSDLASATRFTIAAVVVNASTDGEQFGFGAEIGISTQKLHARGRWSCGSSRTYKYVVEGAGHIRS